MCFGQVSRLAAVLSKSLSLLYAWSWRVFLLRRAPGNDAEGVHCLLRVVGIDGLPQLDFDVNPRWLSSQNPSHQNRSGDIVINVSDIRTFSKQVHRLCNIQQASSQALHLSALLRLISSRRALGRATVPGLIPNNDSSALARVSL